MCGNMTISCALVDRRFSVTESVADKNAPNWMAVVEIAAGTTQIAQSPDTQDNDTMTVGEHKVVGHSTPAMRMSLWSVWKR